MWESITDLFLDNPLWSIVLIIAGGIGAWFGYDGIRTRKKNSLHEDWDIRIRDGIRNFVFLLMILLGIFGLIKNWFSIS